MEPDQLESPQQDDIQQPAVEQESLPADQAYQTEAESEQPPRKVVKMLDKEFEFDPDFPDDKIEKFRQLYEGTYKDYTKTKQQLAEEKRQLEQAKQQIEEAARFANEYRTEVGKLAVLDEQLKEWMKVTPEQWEQFAEQNPQEAQKAFLKFEALKRQHAAIQQTVQEKMQTLRQHQEQQQAEQRQKLEQYLEHAKQYLATKIPEWSPAKQKALSEFAAKEYGFTNEELGSIIDPRAVMILHDAYLYRQSRQKVVQQSEQPAAKPEPASKVGTTAAAAKNPDNMSVSDWLKWREAQLRNRR